MASFFYTDEEFAEKVKAEIHLPHLMHAIHEQMVVKFFQWFESVDHREVKTALEIYDRLRSLLEPQFAALTETTDTQTSDTYDPLKDFIEEPEDPEN